MCDHVISHYLFRNCLFLCCGECLMLLLQSLLLLLLLPPLVTTTPPPPPPTPPPAYAAAPLLPRCRHCAGQLTVIFSFLPPTFLRLAPLASTAEQFQHLLLIYLSWKAAHRVIDQQKRIRKRIYVAYFLYYYFFLPQFTMQYVFFKLTLWSGSFFGSAFSFSMLVEF